MQHVPCRASSCPGEQQVERDKTDVVFFFFLSLMFQEGTSSGKEVPWNLQTPPSQTNHPPQYSGEVDEEERGLP